MTRSQHRAFGETLAVFALSGALTLASLFAPPDPFTQLRYAAVGLAVSTLAAAVLVYGRDYRRIRLTFRGLVVVWLSTLLFAGLAQSVFGPRPTGAALAGETAALTAGLAAGVWLAYHDGLARLRRSLF